MDELAGASERSADRVAVVRKRIAAFASTPPYLIERNCAGGLPIVSERMDPALGGRAPISENRAEMVRRDAAPHELQLVDPEHPMEALHARPRGWEEIRK